MAHWSYGLRGPRESAPDTADDAINFATSEYLNDPRVRSVRDGSIDLHCGQSIVVTVDDAGYDEYEQIPLAAWHIARTNDGGENLFEEKSGECPWDEDHICDDTTGVICDYLDNAARDAKRARAAVQAISEGLTLLDKGDRKEAEDLIGQGESLIVELWSEAGYDAGMAGLTRAAFEVLDGAKDVSEAVRSALFTELAGMLSDEAAGELFREFGLPAPGS